MDIVEGPLRNGRVGAARSGGTGRDPCNHGRCLIQALGVLLAWQSSQARTQTSAATA
jgi:hypothetical protein